MSHKHNYTHYSNLSKPQEAPVVEPEVKVEETIEEVVAPVTSEPVVDAESEPVADPDPETTEDNDELIGIVTGCAKLNVRAEASTDADVVATLSSGAEVLVDIFASTTEFYKVTTASGLEGFCMQKFINVD